MIPVYKYLNSLTDAKGPSQALTYKQRPEHVDGHHTVLVDERAEYHVAHDGAYPAAHHCHRHGCSAGIQNIIVNIDM